MAGIGTGTGTGIGTGIGMGIGIVGAGISGLTLALRLQQLGVGTTLYCEGDADALRKGRLPATVVRMGHTQARERELGSEHYRDPACLMSTAKLSIKGSRRWSSRPPSPSRSTRWTSGCCCPRSWTTTSGAAASSSCPARLRTPRRWIAGRSGTS
ncbi:hypothetical protein ACFQ0B_71545 [Nonomuraea thailandensis]